MGECLITRRGGESYELPVLNEAYPADVTIVESASGSATFQIVIDTPGKPAEYTYQWYVNGSAVSGATGSTYTRTNLTSAATYNVYCEVSNKAGIVTSRIANLAVTSAFPSFTYSGSHSGIIKDGGYNWRIKFYTSGTLVITHLGNASTINAFYVGGGGGDGWSGAGGGGYVKNVTTTLSATSYVITVGSGGGSGTKGGTSSAFGYSSEGGYPGNSGSGGNGGSGGGGSGAGNNAGGKGGSNGSNGGDGVGTFDTSASTFATRGGTGKGDSTYEFGDSSGTLYAGGGGGSYADGGAGGGGKGGKIALSITGSNGSTNTGGGGGAGGYSGGSGIIVIRNAR